MTEPAGTASARGAWRRRALRAINPGVVLRAVNPGAALRAAGIDSTLRWPWLLMALVLAPGAASGRRPWPQSLAELFPQVDFNRPSPLDLLRIPIQLLWLVLVRPAEVSGCVVPPAPAPRARTWGPALRRALRRVWRRADAAIDAALRGPARAIKALHDASAPAPGCGARLRRCAVGLLCAAATVVLIATPLATSEQAALAATLWLATLLLRRMAGPGIALVMACLSVFASTRYLWWRFAYTLNWDAPLDLAWGVLLLMAESYAWLMLLLGYFQTVHPLRRATVALPVDRRLWPTVDVFIPTYNEPPSVVMPTVDAALALDWPRDKLRVHLLDDGRREWFRRFAQAVGANYVARRDCHHAKAGNLNHALWRTNAAFVVIFDCDHVPTRTFLRETIGGFLVAPKLALVQTPHHFFSPDPFERNLDKFRRIPNELELFHSLVQDGNDLWNATFFCGSCAVLRRSAIEQIGGFAVETVTEDAHTALRLQRHGFDSALVNVPLAAGLATESLSAHIGQRIRWARGMAQIFRLDNPLLGRGLSWPQRLCYASSMLHFFNGGPRLVFLTAPIAFLLAGVHVIEAAPLEVLLYVLPHMAIASLTNSRLQGTHRGSFWSEVYETVLAWYITWPTLAALLSPRKGKFNVTVKGAGVQQGYFNWTLALPFLALAGLNLAAFGIGASRLSWASGAELGTTLLNMGWSGLNVVLLGAAIAVALEPPQRRGAHRVPLSVAAMLELPDGRRLRTLTHDVSAGGAALALPLGHVLARDALIVVTLGRGREAVHCRGRVAAVAPRGVHVHWQGVTREQRRALVQCTFARRNAWSSWRHGRRPDRLLRSLREVLDTGVAGYQRLGSHMLAGAVRRSAPLRRATRPLLRGTASLLPRTPVALAASL